MRYEGTFACPSCGFELPAGASICGSCATVVGRPLADTTLAARSSGAPKLLLFLLLLGLLAGGYQLARDEAEELIANIREWEFDEPGVELDAGPIPGKQRGDGAEGARVDARTHTGVRDLARAINRGGVRCRNVTVDQSDEYTETGSCQARGVHVQINVYLQDSVIEFAERTFGRDYAFPFVHDGNWWIISSLDTLRPIHEILGGRLTRPRAD